jgi:hypothetical protein
VKLKDRAMTYVLFEKPLDEYCLIRIKNQVGKKMSAVEV